MKRRKKGKLLLLKNSIVKYFGYLILVISLFFILDKIWMSRELIFKWQISLADGFIMGLLATGYAIASVLQATAWFNFLKYFGYRDIRFQDCFSIYAKTQIAKYMPGNIFHFTTRHLSGRELGIKDGSLVAATFSEISGLIIASASVSLTGLLMWETHSGFLSFFQILMLLIAALSFGLILKKILQMPKIREKFFFDELPYNSKIFSLNFALYILFFLLTGSLFTLLIYFLITPVKLSGVMPVVIVFSISWLAGYITPGAPGGMGVREAVMISVLSHYMSEPESVMAALLFRIVTVSGDFILFLFSFLKFFINHNAGVVGKRK